MTFSDCNCQETSSIITSEAPGRRKVWGVRLVRAQQWLSQNQWSLDKDANRPAHKLRFLPLAKCVPEAREPIKSWLQGAPVTWFLYFLKDKYWEVHLTIFFWIDCDVVGLYTAAESSMVVTQEVCRAFSELPMLQISFSMHKHAHHARPYSFIYLDIYLCMLIYIILL